MDNNLFSFPPFCQENLSKFLYVFLLLLELQKAKNGSPTGTSGGRRHLRRGLSAPSDPEGAPEGTS